MEMSRQETRIGEAQESRFDSSHGGEELALRNDAVSVYDPRLLNMSLSGTFGLSQDRLSIDDNAFHGGTLRGYDVVADFLGEQATSVTLLANRNQSLLSRPLAGRSEAISESQGVVLSARRLYLPSKLTLRQEQQEETSRTGDVVARRDDHRNILTYEALRGWTNQDLAVRYELVDLDARVLPTLSYRSQDASLMYGLDFGSELNRHWDSQVHYLARTGSTDLTTMTSDETLRVDHSDRFSTEYRYLLTYSETLGQATTNHTGTFRLRHRLYKNLITSFGLDKSLELLPSGTINTNRSQLDFAYTKQLPAQGQLSAGLGGKLEYQDDRFDDTNSFVPQETHTASSPVALPITLDRPFVVTSSVSVTKTSLGPLPDGCLPPSGPPVLLVEGRDYTLFTVGNLTQIVPVPCSGVIPGINPGDTIAADYQFRVSPSLTFTTVGWRTDLSLDYHWIRPYVAHQQLAQHLLEGVDDGLLDHQQSDAIGVELRADGRRARGSLGLEADRFDSGRLSYEQLRSTQYVGWSIAPPLTLSLSGDQALLTFSDQGHQTRTFMGRVTLTYLLSASAVVDASGGVRALQDTLLPSERHTDATVRMRWHVRALEINPSFEVWDRQRDQTHTREYRVFVHVVRHF